MISASQKRVTGKESIFDTLSQVLVVDASKIIPTVDRVLVRDVPENERRGSIFLPESAQNREPVRQGIVVAVGPGDKYTEHGFDQTGQVRRRQVACEECLGYGTRGWLPGETAINLDDPNLDMRCPLCGGSGCGRLPMPVKVGDRVLYSRRKDLEVFVAGERLSLVNVEQSVYGILEE